MKHQEIDKRSPNCYRIISLGAPAAKELFVEEENDDEPSLDVSTLKDVPKNLEPVANALYGAVEGTTDDSEAAPPLALPLAQPKSNSDRAL